MLLYIIILLFLLSHLIADFNTFTWTMLQSQACGRILSFAVTSADIDS